MAAKFRDSLATEMYQEGRCEDWDQCVRVAEIRLMVAGYRSAIEKTSVVMADEVEKFLEEGG